MALHSYLVAVGSNIGDRRATVKRALEMIVERGLTIDSKSELVETAPIGAADQVFLNGAFICTGDIAPDDFMRMLLDIEASLGRVRDVRWGNRTIDLDVLLVRNESGESVECHSQLLEVPHPRMLERDFMMRPASAVAGHWVLPHSEANLRELCVSRGWRPTWSNPKGDIKLWQALKGDVYSATTSRLWWPTLLVMLFFRLWLAASIPYGNDEAYYWDWGRAPQTSYFDHPPFVSWISWASRLLVMSWTEGPLQGRLLVPFIHLGATLMLGALAVRLMRRVLTNLESRAVLLLTQLVPAFSLGGIMLMPDIGLIFFSTLAAWFVLAVSRRENLRWWVGILVGIFLGFAGLSKYHAALIGGGLLAWLFWRRQESFDEEKSFWVFVIITGLITISPVLLWNASHDWASFRYQGSRGISSSFEVVRALRTVAGEALFLGPAVVFGLWFAWQKRKSLWDGEASVIVWTALPMLVVLKFFSFTTQTLPHWSMPSFWLFNVFLVPILANSIKLRWSSRIYGALFCILLPSMLAIQQSRRVLIRWTGDRPGGLGELTLWESASRDQEFLAWVFDESWLRKAKNRKSQLCKRGVVFAAPRWFTVAQAAANLPRHLVIETLDQDHKSYYHFRAKAPVVGCPVVILAEKSHWQNDGWNDSIQMLDQREFEIDGHRDRLVIIGRGYFKEDPISSN